MAMGGTMSSVNDRDGVDDSDPGQVEISEHPSIFIKQSESQLPTIVQQASGTSLPDLVSPTRDVDKGLSPDAASSGPLDPGVHVGNVSGRVLLKPSPSQGSFSAVETTGGLDYGYVPGDTARDGISVNLRGGEDGNVQLSHTAVNEGWWTETKAEPISTGQSARTRQATNLATMNPSQDTIVITDDSSVIELDLWEDPQPATQPGRGTGRNNFQAAPRKRANPASGVRDERPTKRLAGTDDTGLTLHEKLLAPVHIEKNNTYQAPPAIPQPGWSFNSREPLPWHGTTGLRYDGVRQFARCNDKALLDYLAHRRVAPGFLVEIDMFIRAHPEVVRYAPSFIQLINSLPPLEAYLYFLKGYTRPARYVEGVIRTDAFTLSPYFRPMSITMIRDKELDDFFEGFDYRYDILDRVDNEVRHACTNIRYGCFVPHALRRLVCYAVFGNPVDAYKYFEYNYQQEYMPHRYLPEHVVLGEIPKPSEYSEPVPSSVPGWKKHRDIRYRMARANDQGVDVIDVLMAEFRIKLSKNGFRRPDIESRCLEAKQRIDAERQHPQGLDIVDMIMDMAEVAQDRNVRRVPVPARPPPTHAARKDVRRGRTNSTHLDPVGRELHQEKTLLIRLYTQEVSARPRHSDLIAVQKLRRASERRYVNKLVRYCKQNQQMDAMVAKDLLAKFTKKNTKDCGLEYKDYLLGLYPKELK